MKFVVALVATAAAASARTLQEPALVAKYEEWKAAHPQRLSAQRGLADDEARYATWVSNYQFVQQHNAAGRKYTVKMNKFADLSTAEYKKLMGLKPRPASVRPKATWAGLEEGASAPASVDWRTAGNVSPVKDQGQCGSCWAFSAVGAMEVSISIASGLAPVSLAEQELVSCDTKRDDGCDGGDMDTALDWVLDNGGLAPTADYPYTAYDDSCDTAQLTNIAGSISRYDYIPSREETSMISAASTSALSVGINADSRNFMLYDGGIFDDDNDTCDPDDRDHGTVIVGYEAGIDDPLTDGYWIMRNSWGADWGEDGYMNVAMGIGKKGCCGIAEEPIIAFA